MAPLRSNKKAREHSWQLQEAKSRLSKVVEHALQDGPQTITLRGKPAVVIISYDEFQNLIRPRTTLREFIRESPLYETALDIERLKDISREVDL